MPPTGGARHEHRHPGCGRPRLEARRGCAAGAARPARDYEIERRRWRAQRQGGEPQSRPHAGHALAPPAAEISSRAPRAPTRELARGSPRSCGKNGSPTASFGYRYDASPIVWPDGTPAPPLPTSTYAQTARPGARAPHAWLADGRSTLDLFGRGFTCCGWAPIHACGEGIRAAAAAAGVPLDLIGSTSRRSRALSAGAGFGAPGRTRGLARRRSLRGRRRSPMLGRGATLI